MHLKRIQVLIILISVGYLSSGCNNKKVLNREELVNYAQSTFPEDIKRHIAVLAHDSLKGRFPGTPEYKKAMTYVINQYKSLGITPLGDESGTSYYQKLKLRTSIIDESKSHLILNKKDTLLPGQDYFFLGNANNVSIEFEGDLVVAGYGIKAEEYGYNDFDDIDVKDKIVIIFWDAPNHLPAIPRAHYGRIQTKIKDLDVLGAKGVLVVHPGNLNKGYLNRSQNGFTNVITKAGVAVGQTNFGNNMKFGAFVSWDFIKTLIRTDEPSWRNYVANGELQQLKTVVKIEGRATSIFTEVETANVIGVIEGGALKDEFVIHTAHLDHLGIGEKVNGDSIYNGAHDNASGISAMLEIAKLYSNLSVRPKRSVIFAAVTAEEMGLLGSKYFVANPPIPIENIIVNINTDMPAFIAPLLSIEALGAEQTNLLTTIELNAQQLGLEINPDHAPERVRYVRSDNYSFVQAGIPSFRIKYGLKAEHSPAGLETIINKFTKEVYHKPSDELNESFDFEAARKYVALQFMNSYLINNTDDRPRWKENSFFNDGKK